MGMPHDWLDYASAIGAVAGIVTGVTGMGYGIAAFNKTKELKSLDLRIQLKTADATLRLAASELPDLLARADQSRKRSLAADGLGMSGAWKVWEQQHAIDIEEVNRLSALLPSRSKDYGALVQQQLETELVSTHELQLRVDRLMDKYGKGLADDAEAVKRRMNVAQQQVLAAKYSGSSRS